MMALVDLNSWSTCSCMFIFVQYSEVFCCLLSSGIPFVSLLSWYCAKSSWWWVPWLGWSACSTSWLLKGLSCWGSCYWASSSSSSPSLAISSSSSFNSVRRYDSCMLAYRWWLIWDLLLWFLRWLFSRERLPVSLPSLIALFLDYNNAALPAFFALCYC